MLLRVALMLCCVGDLRGRVHVAEQTTGDDPMAWGELRPFKSGERTLKFNNW